MCLGQFLLRMSAFVLRFTTTTLFSFRSQLTITLKTDAVKLILRKSVNQNKEIEINLSHM
jgi:hypothetical protein